MPRTWQQTFDLGSSTPAPEPPEPQAGLLRRLREGLARSRQALAGELRATFFDQVDEATWERLEEALILADVGARVTAEVVGRLEAEVEAGDLAPGEPLRRRLVQLLAERATPPGSGLAMQQQNRLSGNARPDPLRISVAARPSVILVVGVNGGGKTTTIGKLAWHLQRELGLSVLLAAGDTFRAAAVDQLAQWADRAGCEIVRAEPDSDPGAVVYDAVAAATARGTDVVLADTAGRLHTHENLMAELAKVRRVIAKQIPEAPHETLLVVDATTGQNGLRQARLFAEAVEVTGIVLTKLDGTAKGGIALAIAAELGIPVKLIGVGEGLEDLRPFDPEEFATALLGE